MFIKIQTQPRYLENKPIQNRIIFLPTRKRLIGKVVLVLSALLVALYLLQTHYQPNLHYFLKSVFVNAWAESELEIQGTVYNGVDSITFPKTTKQNTTNDSLPDRSMVIKSTAPSSTNTTTGSQVSDKTMSKLNGINQRNEWGWTKLFSATIEGNLQGVIELLEHGADPNITDEDGRSPLMAASLNKHSEIVLTLIKTNANVDLRNRDGWTALSFAAWNGDSESVVHLLKATASKNIKTSEGYTPYQLAEKKGHLEILTLLK